MINRLAILGNGRVGTYLAYAFRQMGLEVDVFARKPLTGQKPWKEISTNADLCILCIADRFIEEVSAQIPAQNGILVHTSGSINLEALNTKHPKRGIFYPLMSIKKDSSFEIQKIPFCLEATNSTILEDLENFSQSNGLQHYAISSDKRKYLHLAAVLSHNFSNYLYHQAFETLKEADIPFSILKPLLEQQVNLLDDSDPILKQTGPAVRKDEPTMEAHFKMLQNPEIADLYQRLSQLIQKEYGEKL